MPVWQQYYKQRRDQGVEVLSVAMDAQGADRARLYVERARAEFTTAVDESNLLGQLYGFKAIPNGFLIDEQGIVRYKKLGGFDIRKAETARLVEDWSARDSIELSLEQAEQVLGEEHSEANALFSQGHRLYREGKAQEALALWREAMRLEPDNWVIRKQVWAVENPDRFYSGEVDYAWQKEQIASGQ